MSLFCEAMQTSAYSTEVLKDISDFPFILNKDYQYSVLK